MPEAAQTALRRPPTSNRRHSCFTANYIVLYLFYRLVVLNNIIIIRIPLLDFITYYYMDQEVDIYGTWTAAAAVTGCENEQASFIE